MQMKDEKKNEKNATKQENYFQCQKMNLNKIQFVCGSEIRLTSR